VKYNGCYCDQKQYYCDDHLVFILRACGCKQEFSRDAYSGVVGYFVILNTVQRYPLFTRYRSAGIKTPVRPAPCWPPENGYALFCVSSFTDSASNLRALICRLFKHRLEQTASWLSQVWTND
jgi:hypothetical protein